MKTSKIIIMFAMACLAIGSFAVAYFHNANSMRNVVIDVSASPESKLHTSIQGVGGKGRRGGGGGLMNSYAMSSLSSNRAGNS